MFGRAGYTFEFGKLTQFTNFATCFSEFIFSARRGGRAVGIKINPHIFIFVVGWAEAIGRFIVLLKWGQVVVLQLLFPCRLACLFLVTQSLLEVSAEL
ncbi:MAG TPA: hypothetical protein DEO64_06450 [Alcaligenes faecalis]|nr:hypothetical protein [Alcaligenes faecalis]